MVAFVTAPLGGCGLFSGLFSGGTGTLRVLITDKPFPTSMVCSAIVTIERIDVRLAGADSDEHDADDANEPANDDADMTNGIPEMDNEGFITILTHSRSFNLLDLQNGRTDLLADAEIPAGEYDEMRLVVSGGQITVKNSPDADCADGMNTTTCNLKVPSGEQSGIKLNFEFEVMDGQQTTLLLDVDLSRAFQLVPSGNDNTVDPENCGFHFHPAFAMHLINVLDAGTISGNVTNAADQTPISGATVMAFEGTEQVTSAMTETDGSYMLSGLHTGTYRVQFEASGFQPANVENVSVTAGQGTGGVDAALTMSSP
jgi:hypothetical protein